VPQLNNGLAVAGAVGALLVLPAAAFAADRPVVVPVVVAPVVVPVYDWTGVILGIQAGGAWSRTRVTDVEGTHFFFGPGDSRSIDRSKFAWGLWAGYQRQFGNVVVGFEGDAVWSHLTRTISTPGPNVTTNHRVDLQNLYSVTGKLGWAYDRWLFYGRAGWAFNEVSTQSDEFPVFNHFGRSSGHFDGFVVAAGFDYAMTWHRILVGLEYDYYGLGSQTQGSLDSTGLPFVVRVHPVVQTVMGRLSVKFR
jgi:outer membrane immunogenic protein